MGPGLDEPLDPPDALLQFCGAPEADQPPALASPGTGWQKDRDMPERSSVTIWRKWQRCQIHQMPISKKAGITYFYL